MAELYPGGPVTLPCRISVAGEVVAARFVSAPTIAYYVATAQWGVLANKLFIVPDRIQDRMADLDDEFDAEDLAQAAILLSVRLSGAGDDILAWRVMMHMCGVMVQDWMTIVGRLAAIGIDPETAQFWRIIAAVRHLITDGASGEYRAWVERTLEYPLPVEPKCVPGAGSLAAVRRRSSADFARMAREIGG